MTDYINPRNWLLHMPNQRNLCDKINFDIGSGISCSANTMLMTSILSSNSKYKTHTFSKTFFQAHIKECDYEEILCEYDCGASYQRRYNQKHVDKECGKKIISCTYCNDRFLREDKKVNEMIFYYDDV